MAISLKQVKKELRSKERTVNDLCEYINNRTDNTPNYTMLLGAGCSVTSGISPASELIKNWKREIFCSENHNARFGDKVNWDDIDAYFQSESVASWYDSRNEYSCLFEHKFDLPRQRRVFVERQVSGKTPSLGYAYLIQLVKTKFFNTIFTTNFDDLINEAFYQFSNERPIVCAHDSAISSITVTSQRPKIIKLHGDYLFDDIKSTSKETESLEDNTRNKFVEFAKDFGVIVAGYAGNDRSVMDVFSYLLKQEQYFKHGIYWCLRGDSEINGELRKLFWRDRVYFVEIDGFDELMAMLNDDLSSGSLPLDTYESSNRAIDTVSKITKNEKIINSKCGIISRDLRLLRERLKSDALEIAMGVINEDKIFGQDETGTEESINDMYKISKKDRGVLNNISVLMSARQVDEAQKIIDTELKKSELGNAYKKELYLLRAKASIEEGCQKKVLDSYVELSRMSKKNVAPLLNLAHFSSKIEDKLEYVDKAIHIDPYDSRVYASKAIVISDEISNSSDESVRRLSNEFLDLVNTGIDVNPKYSNLCYTMKFDHYFMMKSLYSDDSCLRECESILTKMEAQNPLAPEVTKLRFRLLVENAREAGGVGYLDLEPVLNYLKEIKERSVDRYSGSCDILFLQYYRIANNKIGIERVINEFESEHNVSSAYLFEKSKALLSSCKDLSGSIQALEQSVDLFVDTASQRRLMLLYIYNEEYEKAKKVCDKLAMVDSHALEMFYEESGDYENALNENIQRNGAAVSNPELLIERSFYLLKLERHQDTFDLLSGKTSNRARSKIYLTVNYELARKGIGRSFRQKQISELKKNEEKNLQQAALLCLSGDSDKALKLIEYAIECDYENKFTIRHWPVFDCLRDNPNFISIIS